MIVKDLCNKLKAYAQNQGQWRVTSSNVSSLY